MSQIATTIEQSKCLLAAGIDPESADMYWGHVDFGGCFQITLLPANPHLDINSTISPAWSLSRLWDLLSGTILGGWFSVGSSKSEDIIEELVRMMEQRHANDGTLSKELLK